MTKAEKKNEKSNETRIGVYTCYCGGNISSVVDCEFVASQMKNRDDVVVSRTDMSMCSDAGQVLIEQDIRERGVNRVVIGACAPALHEQTFRNTLSRAGLNPYLYTHVGLREQVSWVHHDDKQGATHKAVRLLNAGIAKARLLEPLEPIKLKAQSHALVIGGGVAGLKAAWDIAEKDIHVTLIERSPFLGGRMAQLEKTFPTEKSARDSLHGLIEKVWAHPKIIVETRAQITGLSGYVGNFDAEITQDSRGVASNGANILEAMQACPVEIPDEFNYGLTTRKAIYKSYPNAYPDLPAIDWENCTLCKECKVAGGDGIDLAHKQTKTSLQVGAIVVATGFAPYEPTSGEFGYGEFPEVVTMPKFIRALELNSEEDTLSIHGREIRSIGVVHCVGSRQITGQHVPQEDGSVNDYCSRVCCTASLHSSNEVLRRFPNIKLSHFYEDIRTYGRGHEDYYRDASTNGIRFFRFQSGDEIKVEPDEQSDYALNLTLKDRLTWQEEIEVPLDLIVLAVGMMPNPVDDIIDLLKISKGKDRFLLEVHPKLRPVETAVNGVVLAGTAQGPMNIQEASTAASSAAAKVAILLGSGQVELDPFIARVNEDLCTGSGNCVEVCPYEDAISLVKTNGKLQAEISPANCVGCGACVSACPNGALDLLGWTVEQYEAMIDAIVLEPVELETIGG